MLLIVMITFINDGALISISYDNLATTGSPVCFCWWAMFGCSFVPSAHYHLTFVFYFSFRSTGTLWRWSPLQAWWAQLVAAHQFSSWERRWTLTSQYPAASIWLSKVFFLTCHSHRLHWQSERHICKLGTAALGVRKGGDTSIPSGDPACGKKSIFYPSHLDIRFFNLTEETWGLFILVRKVTWLFNFPWFFLQLSITALLTLFSARTYNKFFFQVREVSDQRKDALPELDALSDSI